ncbi:MAG: ERF family protein [Flavobacteriaceae bacterium]|nr:ERF family protein [Flavobacteriaceae bacterium]
MIKFQNECPPVLKTKAGYDNRYYYAPLDQIISTIKSALFNNNLTYRWDDSKKDNELIVTCVITHIDGHSEKTTLEGVADSSGGKNTIQSKGSTVQYLRRYTLESVLGIATSATDNDGGEPKKIKKAESSELLIKAKITIDEYSGRILVDAGLAAEEKKKIDKLFS